MKGFFTGKHRGIDSTGGDLGTGRVNLALTKGMLIPRLVCDWIGTGWLDPHFTLVTDQADDVPIYLESLPGIKESPQVLMATIK